MKRMLLLFAFAALALSVAASAAGNAHFIKSQTSASLDGNNLVCSFKEAGLSAGSTETVTCSANASATYECINGGNKHPQAANKETVNATVSGSGTFQVDQNGNIVGSVTATPPGPGDFSCPSGQTMVLSSVSYSNVTLTDSTSGASISLGNP
jgi:hypothetical protein